MITIIEDVLRWWLLFKKPWDNRPEVLKSRRLPTCFADSYNPETDPPFIEHEVKHLKLKIKELELENSNLYSHLRKAI